MSFKEIFVESSEGGEAIKALRRLNYDIDGALDAKDAKDVKTVINQWLEDEDEIGDEMELEGKELRQYIKYLKDIQSDPKGAWKVISED